VPISGLSGNDNIVLVVVFVVLGIIAGVQALGMAYLGPIGLSMCCACFFGVSHFLIAYAAADSTELSGFMASMFFVQLVFALVLHPVFKLTHEGYDDEVAAASIQSVWSKLCLVLSGSCVGLAQICLCWGFHGDPVSSGPNTAVACSHFLVVTLFFRMYGGEVLSWGQVAGSGLILVGLLIMSGVFSWNAKALSMVPFFWCVAAMCFYAISCISMRLNVTSGIAARPGLVSRLASISVIGLAWLLWIQLVPGNSHTTFGVELRDAPFIIMCAVADCMGCFCGIRSFEAPGAVTGVNAAIFDSNSIVVVVLNVALLSYGPSWLKYLGMVFVVAGCCSMSLAGRPRNADDELDISKGFYLSRQHSLEAPPSRQTSLSDHGTFSRRHSVAA